MEELRRDNQAATSGFHFQPPKPRKATPPCKMQAEHWFAIVGLSFVLGYAIAFWLWGK